MSGRRESGLWEASAELAEGLAGGHGCGERNVEAAAAAFHRNQETRIGIVVDMVRNAGRFAAEEQYVPVRIREIRIGHRSLVEKRSNLRPSARRHSSKRSKSTWRVRAAISR